MSTTSRHIATRILTILIIAVFFCSSFFLMIPQDNISVYATGETGQITASKLYVRSGAGTSYKKLGYMKKGATFTVTGSAKDKSGVTWYKLKYNSKNGYVSSKYVNIKQPSVTSVSNTTGTVNLSSGTLNVRSGPGTGYSRIGSLAKGKTFAITGKTTVSGKTWYRLTYNGKTGYVSASYVKTSSTTSTKSSSSSSSTSSTSSKSTSSSSASTQTTQAVTFTLGTVKTSGSSLNVRKGAGTSYAKLGTLSDGSSVTVTGSSKDKNGKVWYTYQYSSSQTGYICSDYVTVKTVTSDAEFEAYMTQQGFPDSYKSGLRALHATHPNWTFKAVNVGSWSTALAAETKNPGTNLVSSSSPTSYRSTASGAYNSSTKTWTKFDGSWYSASSTVVAYYMDPRNFLDESGIYQFMTHKYDSSTQSATTVAAVVKGSFMETRSPGSGYSSYASLINDAGKASGVNPNVLAAMIVQEQGTSGTSGLISGTYSGYKGYYNFFNIGAYTTASRNKIQQGLWYASQSGSYSRPWNSIYKSIKGGAEFYSTNYVSKNQDTYYTKKFNVKNGTSKIGTHQYMTNVAGAASEGKLLKKAFTDNSNYTATFEIPVYTSMPSSACTLP